MTKPNPENERQKRAYFAFLREAHGRDEATIDRVAASLARFEASTKARDFGRFHREQAVAFKARLLETANARTGERLSKATVLSTLRDLRAFFLWLAREPGFRSKIAFSDADYFNLPDKDVAVARARREPNPPTIDQMRRVLEVMPSGAVLGRRDRALVAFAALTGARASALASFRLGHVNVADGIATSPARSTAFRGGRRLKSIQTSFSHRNGRAREGESWFLKPRATNSIIWTRHISGTRSHSCRRIFDGTTPRRSASWNLSKMARRSRGH
ncbi:hypothetical protein [Methylocella sp.]|uniref:hypothetical protein n=1 Tax=Methylocella sp. TaxID=1978226 RepID=UPI003783A05C